MKIWRNDKKPDMSATPSTVVPVAEDILAEDLDGYSVKIVHVFAWFGRGFMPSAISMENTPEMVTCFTERTKWHISLPWKMDFRSQN